MDPTRRSDAGSSRSHAATRRSARPPGPRAIGDAQAELPFVVQLVENPRYDLPGFDVFRGATSLQTHDYIHIVLGRGLLPKDESFVIGFTMGSTDRVSTTEEQLYAIFSKYLYPKDYRRTDDDLRVFRDAVKLGYVSACRSLATIDFAPYLDWPLGAIRDDLGLGGPPCRAYYAIEKRRFPGRSRASACSVTEWHLQVGEESRPR